MNIIRNVSYIEGMDANKLTQSVKRKIEVELSWSCYNCNDISFIYRITPQMCVDCLNLQQHKYDDIFEDIDITYLNIKIVVVNYIMNTVYKVFSIEKITFNKPSNIYSLEEG